MEEALSHKSKDSAMNMEQKEQRMAEIHKLEGLLVYAVAHGEKEEAARIRNELVKMVEAL